jgi:phage terminase large subunit GpA-like protein
MKPPIGEMQYSQPLSQRQAQPATAKPSAPHKRADALCHAKLLVFSRLRTQAPGPGFIHFPAGRGIDDE